MTVMPIRDDAARKAYMRNYYQRHRKALLKKRRAQRAIDRSNRLLVEQMRQEAHAKMAETAATKESCDEELRDAIARETDRDERAELLPRSLEPQAAA